MNSLYAFLKELKKIEARPEYVRRSREIILASREQPVLADRLLRYIHAHFDIQFRAALVAFFLLLVGVFSIWQLVFPLTLSSLDPIAIRAEADAIDIQIQLMNLTYQEAAESARNDAAPPLPQLEALQSEAEELGITLRTFSSSTGAEVADPLTIEEALERLSR